MTLRECPFCGGEIRIDLERIERQHHGGQDHATIAKLRGALEEISDPLNLPENDWSPRDVFGDYNETGNGRGVDPSNMGDVHDHGWTCGAWEKAKIARAALEESHDE